MGAGGLGKSGGAGKQYNYYGTLAGAVCLGPNEDIVSIILNSQEVWPKGKAWAVGITCAPGTLYVFDAQTWTCTSSHVASAANAPGSGLEGWTEYLFTRGSETSDDFTLTASDGTHYGTMTFFWGTAAQTVDSLLTSANNDGGVKGNLGSGDQHPDYEGLVYVVIKDFLLGTDVQAGPNIEIVTRRKPNQTIITGAAALVTDGQANLAAVAAEILTDENCLALPGALIDTTSFQAVADWLQTYQDKYGASVLIDSAESITAIFDKLTQMFDGYVRFNPTTQKIELGVYQHGQIPGAYTTLTADSFTKFPKFNAKSWQSSISRATVRFNSRQLNYQQTSVQVDDARVFAVLGAVREQSLDRPWIARPAQAMIHGQETLRVMGHAQMTGELEVRREIGRSIRAGDYVLVDVDLEPNTNSLYQFFRVTSRKIPPTGPITLSVFADNTLAAIPWNNPSTPITITEPAVPPITAFRFLAVPTALAGARENIVALAQRPNNLIVGAALYFDTDPAGTFSLLGQLSNFAAQATLYSAVAAGDTALHLTVDTTQVDADYFTQQYSANDAANDVLLAFIVSLVPAGGDAGQVAEDGNGFQLMEICSVSAQTLISAGRYDLTVLRGRKNTSAAAFTTAHTEVWLIPAALLSFFTHQLFDQISANRLAGTTPDHAQFRLCPFTYVNQLALSDATSEPFRFPLASASAPSLTLIAPASYAPAYAVTNYPLVIPVTGTWADPDGNLVEISVALRKSTDTADRVIYDKVFSPVASKTFKTVVSIEQAGNYLIKLVARDATNLVTERDIAVTVTGAGAVCAVVNAFDLNGDQLLGPDDAAPYYNGGGLLSQRGYYANPNRFIPYGLLQLQCSTPGATIHFQTAGIVYNAGALEEDATGQVYASGALQPFHGLIASANASNPPAVYTLAVWATAPGFTDGFKTFFTLKLFYP